MKVWNSGLFQRKQNRLNPLFRNPQLLLIVVMGLIGLGVSLPVLAERQRDVERLMSTNQCQQCDLSGSNLAEAKLEGADLLGANLEKANLRGANLKGADLSSANLIEADLSGADLRDTK
ncbi:MAG: pentapeptide repeat-containing protein, partial [Planktothrix sp.]